MGARVRDNHTATLATLHPVYDVEIYTVGGIFPRVEYTVSRETLLYWLRVARQARGFVVKYSRRWLYAEWEVTLCAGCRARPSLWEQDCDGPYDTVKCGVCNWWAAFDLHSPEPQSVETFS